MILKLFYAVIQSDPPILPLSPASIAIITYNDLEDLPEFFLADTYCFQDDSPINGEKKVILVKLNCHISIIYCFINFNSTEMRYLLEIYSE